MNNENTTNSTNTTNNDWAEREIGALWKKSGANQKYLSGKLKLPKNALMTDEGELGVVIFTNRHKTLEKHPDFRVYLESRSVKSEKDSSEKEGQTEEVVDGIL